MTPSWDDYSRRPVWLVRVTLDECGNTFGSAPCTATGTPCYYCAATCRDKTNYVKSTRDIDVSSDEAPPVAGAVPCLMKVSSLETRIKPDEALTVVGEFKLTLSETDPLPWANPGKTYDVAVNNREVAGAFWRNLVARNPNYKGRQIVVKQGLTGMLAADFDTVFVGILDNISVGFGQVEIKAKDRLKKLEKKYPLKQSSTNVLTADYTGGATMDVVDAEGFMDPAEFGGICTVKVSVSDSAWEYATYTGRDLVNQQLTGCSPGKFGTTAATRAAGATVKNVVIVADDNAAASWAAVNGLGPDLCLLTLLCNYGGIAFADLAVEDFGLTLDGAIDDNDTTITLSSVDELPDTGVLVIGGEAIPFYNRNTTALTVTATERGAFGTTAAAHDNLADVYLSEFSDEAGRWLAGCLYKARFENETALKDMMQGLRKSTSSSVWQGSDLLIHCKFAPTAYFPGAAVALTDNELVGDPAPSLDRNESARRTGIIMLYNPVAADPEDADYQAVLAHVNAEIEAPEYLDERVRETMLCEWIYREAEALLAAAHTLIRRQYGMPLLSFCLDARDARLIDAGDFVRVTTDAVVGVSGAARPEVVYEVVSRQRLESGGDVTWKFTAADVSGGVDGARYGVIAPAAITADYDDADADDQARYCWIAGADDLVGAAGDPGYRIL